MFRVCFVSLVGSPTQTLAGYCANNLQPAAEEASSYVCNAEHFIELIRDIRVGPGHLLVSFDMVSLFTNVPVDNALKIIESRDLLATRSKWIADPKHPTRGL